MVRFYSLLKFICWIVCCVSLYFYQGRVTFVLLDQTITMSLFVLCVVIGLIGLTFFALKSVLFRICKKIVGKPKHEKGLDSLQLAFSNLMMRDYKGTRKHLKKACKYLGNRPILTWIDGQSYLLNDDKESAKAIFYMLSAQEKKTKLGAYSLCKMNEASAQIADISSKNDSEEQIST